MLNYSFSTVMMTVLTSNLLIAVIVGCFRNRKILLSTGYKLIFAILVLAALRFLFPFELPFARNIYFPKWLSAVLVFVQHPFFTLGPVGVSLWLVFECVWAGGTVYHFRRFRRRKAELKRFLLRYGRNVSREEPYRTMMEEICGGRRTPIWVLRVPYYGTPVQCGTLHPYIVLPAQLDVSEEELYYVLRHEAAHYYHHDALIKDIVSIICIIYWWNPLCRYLARQMDITLEMRVDDSLVKGSDAEWESYCSALKHIGEVLRRRLDLPGAKSALPLAQGEDLEYRYSMMRGGQRRKGALFSALSGFAAAAFLLSYSFTLEAHYMPSWTAAELDQGAPEEYYLVPLANGYYDVYIDGVCVDRTDDLKYYNRAAVVREDD